MDTGFLYLEKIEKACILIKNTLKSKPLTLGCIEQEQKNIDSSLRRKINKSTGKRWCYAMERFPISLIMTYHFFCKELKVKPIKSVEKELYKLGMEVYLTVEEYRKHMKPEFKKLVKFLHSQNDCLILLTKGDKRIQNRKIKAMEKEGILKYFCSWYVVDDKNIAIFHRLARTHSGRNPYSIGNEYRSDIEPAIKAGFFGIYIPYLVWDKGNLKNVEKKRDKKKSRRYWNLMDIRKNYKNLNGSHPRI